MEIHGGRASAGNVLGDGSEGLVCGNCYGCSTGSATHDFGKVPWFSYRAGSIISPGSELPFISGCSFLESTKCFFSLKILQVLHYGLSHGIVLCLIPLFPVV